MLLYNARNWQENALSLEFTLYMCSVLEMVHHCQSQQHYFQLQLFIIRGNLEGFNTDSVIRLWLLCGGQDNCPELFEAIW